MYDNSNKKMLIIMIQEILKKYSDAQHKLTQPDIIRYLDSDYGVTCDRRSVKRNILDLIELGYKINIEGGYYLVDRQFDNEEICLVYDSLLQNTHLTKDQLKKLLTKMASYANVYFDLDPAGIRGCAGTKPLELADLFKTIAVIKGAIDRKKKISYTCSVGEEDAGVDQRVVNPYEIVSAGQDYYLICSHNKDDVMDVIQITAMENVHVLDDKIKPLSQIKGGKKSVPAWSRYAQQIVPMIEEDVQVSLLADPSAVSVIKGLFGGKLKITTAENGKKKVVLKCGEDTMPRFALAYGDLVQVTAPESLKVRIADRIAKTEEIYG